MLVNFDLTNDYMTVCVYSKKVVSPKKSLALS